MTVNRSGAITRNSVARVSCLCIRKAAGRVTVSHFTREPLPSHQTSKAFGRLVSGFSLVEILVGIAALAVLAGVALVSITGVPDAARKRKLDQDVAIVNNAIDAYLLAGGDVAQLGADNVISALKQRVAAQGSADITGPQGPFLDPTVTTNTTDFAWSALYTTDPHPRFYVAQSTAGVVFGHGPAMAVGGAAERPDAARTSWLWAYADATPPAQLPAFVPTAVDTGSTATNPVSAVVTLAAPVITPGSLTANLWGFPLQVSIANPNPSGSSRVYYKVGTGNFTLYDNVPFNVDPGITLSAVAVSLDPSRYYNSSVATATYSVTPLQLAVSINAPASVTYAQAGGLIAGQAQQSPATVTIALVDTGGGGSDNLLTDDAGDDKYIPAPYVSSGNFTVRYTTDGSDPLTSATAATGPAFSGYYSPVSVSLGLAAWGTNTNIVIRAAAVALNTNYFTSSPGTSNSVTVAPTVLPLTLFPVSPIGLPNYLAISNIGDVPVGLRTYYTLNGSRPLTADIGGVWMNNAPLYTGRTNAPASGAFTFSAQATGPAGYEQWFASPLTSKTYSPLLSVPFEVLGANIGAGDINGSFRGSIFVSAPADLGIFNAGGQILGGSLYLPGLPGIEITGDKKTDSKTVAVQGQAYTGAGEGTSQIGGKEYMPNGQLADPQLDTRKIVDLDGPITPTNYTVKITKSAYIEGKVYRRSGVRPTTAIPPIPAGLSVYTNSLITGTPETTLAAGVYSNKISMSSSASVLNLGVAGGAVTEYVFGGSGNTFKGTVNVLGPVKIYLDASFGSLGVNVVRFGNATNASWLQIIMQTNNSNSISILNGTMYAQILAPASDMTVKNGTSFTGSLYTKKLDVEPNATVNVDVSGQ